MNFGQAIEALKEGKMVRRTGWNGKGLFVFMQVPSQIGIDVVPKMQSLPQSVKDEFMRRKESASSAEELSNHYSITYSNQMAIVYPNNAISGWAPSASDALAEDWEIL